jgi:hypothetical protein
MEDIAFDIFELVKKKMREQGAYDREAYRQFVEESIDFYLERGRLTDDDNLEFLKDWLEERFEGLDDRLADDE